MKHTKTFIIKGGVIQITVDAIEAFDMSRNKAIAVISAKFRDYNPMYYANNPFKYGAPLIVLQGEDEFWADIAEQINYLNNLSRNQTTLEDHIDACLDAIQKHIEKHNRLIDADMEGFVDCAMHILVACSIKNLSVDMITLRKGIIGEIIEKYGSHIYFARHHAFGTPELVKLKQ